MFSYSEAFLCLTLYDFCLWRYLKSHMYRRGIANLNNLKDLITQHMRKITPDVIHSAVALPGLCPLAQWPWGT